MATSFRGDIISPCLSKLACVEMWRLYTGYSKPKLQGNNSVVSIAPCWRVCVVAIGVLANAVSRAYYKIRSGNTFWNFYTSQTLNVDHAGSVIWKSRYKSLFLWLLHSSLVVHVHIVITFSPYMHYQKIVICSCKGKTCTSNWFCANLILSS